MDSKFDPELIKHGDTRNVTDEFRNMTVESIKAELDTRRHDIEIAIENYQHDFNIGTIVRNANAFNVRAVHIIGKRHWNRRGAMVTDRYMHIHHHATTNDFLQAQTGTTIIGIDNVEGSIKLSTAVLEPGVVLVFGGEGPGLSSEMIAACKEVIAIEQFGSTRSVNVGVASGIVLYEWVRRNAL